MASKAISSSAFLLLVNLILFTFVTSSTATCPKNTLKLGVCANVLHNVANVVVGKPAKSPCCAVIYGLVDLEAAVCFCTAIKANVLGINLNVPLSLSTLVNFCGKKVPSGFRCA